MKGILDKITSKIFLNRNRINNAVGAWKQQFADATRWPATYVFFGRSLTCI